MASGVIKSQGNETLLATITATSLTEYNLADSLENYKFIQLSIAPAQAGGGDQLLSTTFTTVGIFKTHPMQSDYVSGTYNVYCTYVSNTKIKGNVKASGQRGFVYGIN